MKNTLKLIPSALLAFSVGAQAAVTITIQEVGNDVVVRGSGPLNMDDMDCVTDLTEPLDPAINNRDSSSGFGMIVEPSTFAFGELANGRLERGTFCEIHTAIRTGPGIGSGTAQRQGYSTGHHFAFADLEYDLDEGPGLLVFLPDNYYSGMSLVFTGVIEGKTLNDLGLIVGGNYKWTWNTVQTVPPSPIERQDFLSIRVLGASAPSSTTPVPTLGAFGLMGLAGAIGAAGVAMTRRRKK